MRRRPPSPLASPHALVGRDDALALVVAALRAHAALVTILGPGGAGKTVLAAAAAAEARAAGSFPGGVVEVALGGVQTADARVLAARVAAALGLPARSRGGVDEVARGLAARGRALVVLDECEGCLDALTAALAPWRAAATDVAWLLTSRRALGFRDERVVALDGLAPADAVTLLTARVAHARPGWSPDVHDDDAIARIARSLDGLPLALELAASTAATQPLAAVAASLAAQPLGLTGGPDLAERHRSLRAAVTSSVAGLGPAGIDHLAALSTLRAPFDADAAAAVTGLPLDAARALAATFASRSLARAEGPAGRHRLFAAVRAFAAERADPAAAARHAAYFAARASRWTHAFHDGDAAWARPRLDASVDDLFAAVACPDASLSQRVTLVAALDAALTPRGGADALDGVLDDTVAHADRAGDPDARVRARVVRARGRFLRGLVALAHDDTSAARAVDGASTAARREAEILGSAVLRGAGRTDDARASAERAMDSARAEGDRDAWLRAAHQAASARAAAGDCVGAVEDYASLLAEARARGARRVEALCLANLGNVAEADGRLDEAALRLAQGVAAFTAAGEQLLTAKLVAGLARVHVRRGAIDEAQRRAHEATSMAAALRDEETAVEAALVCARIHRLRGRDAEAAVAIEDALATARLLGLDALTRAAESLRTAHGATPDAALRVGSGAYWFEAPGGARVALSRRPSLRRVLAHLVALRASSPGAAASVMALLAAGWPGERVLPEAGAERVYTAVRTLRSMGLQAVLVRRDGGYALDPAVPLAQG